MKKLLLLPFLFLICAENISAQSHFSNTYVDNPNLHPGGAVINTADHGYLVTGTTILNNGNQAGNFILRLSSTGTIVWSKNYDDLATDSHLWGAMETAAGDFLLKYEDVDNFYGGLMKTDKNGSLLFNKKFYNFNFSPAIDNAMIGNGNNFFVCGIDSSTANTVLINLDANGNIIWAKEYNVSDSCPTFLSTLDMDSKGNIIMVGGTDEFDICGQQKGLIVVKVNPSGNLIWSKKIFRTNNTSLALFELIKCDKNHQDRILLSAGVETSNLSNELCSIQLDSSGTLVYSKSYSFSYDVTNISMQILPNSNAFLFENQALLNTDLSGNSKWLKSFYDTTLIIFHYAMDKTFDSGLAIQSAEIDTVLFAATMKVLKLDSALHSGCPEITHPVTDSVMNVSVQNFAVPVSTAAVSIVTNTIPVTVSTPNFITQSGCVTGIDEALHSPLALFPNPATEIVTIQSELRVERTDIFNLFGQKVLTAKQERINISSLKPGVYTVQIYLGENEVVVRKMIKD